MNQWSFHTITIKPTDHLEKYWLIHELPNVNTFHSTIFKKSHSLIPSLIFSEVFTEAVKLVAGTSFLSSNFYLKAQILSLPTNVFSCIPSSDRLILFTCEKMFSSNQVWKTSQFFQVKMVFHEQQWLVCNWNSHTRFSLRQLYFPGWAEVLYVAFPILSHEILKRCALKGWI